MAKIFENVHIPIEEREWRTGDEEYAEMVSQWEAGWEDDAEDWEAPVVLPETVPDPVVQRGFDVIHTDTERLAKGQIWRTKPTDEVPNPKLVVIHRTDVIGDPAVGIDAVQVLPISLQHQYAAQHDFIVERYRSPLGVGFMVEAHLPTLILVSSLEGCVGELDEIDIEALDLLVPDAFGLLHGSANEAARRSVGNMPQGTPIVSSDDLRLRFREREMENLRYLIEPYEKAVEAAAAVQEERPVVEVPAVALLSEGIAARIREQRRRWSEFRDRVIEHVLETRKGWIDAALALARLEPALLAADDEVDLGLERTKQRFLREEGIQVYPASDDTPPIERFVAWVLSTEDGHYLGLCSFAEATRHVKLGVLYVNDEPWFVPNVFPCERDLGRDLWVVPLPIEPSNEPQEVFLPFAVDGVEGVIRFVFSPSSRSENH